MTPIEETVTVKGLTLYTEAWNGDPSDGRNKFIGGSDVGSIMGANKFKSSYQLFLEKTGQLDPENLDTKLSVKLGHKMEQVVAELYEDETGERVQNSNRSYRVKEYPFLIGHIDRKIVGKKKGLEIKTTSSYNKTDYADGEVPPSHYYQCMFYMIVTGLHDWDLVTLRDNRELHITHIAWNEEVATHMLKECIHFWKCVEAKHWDMPIDGSESTSDTLDKVYMDVDPSENKTLATVKLNGIGTDEYFETKRLLETLKEQSNAFENTMKQALGSSECGILDDRYIVSWKQYERKGAIDTNKLFADHPEIREEAYRKPPTTYRKFGIKEIKRKKEIKD